MRNLVKFRYSDGRLPAHRFLEISAAKTHEVAQGAGVEIVEGWDTYLAFCDEHGHEPLATRESLPEPSVEPEEAAAPEEAEAVAPAAPAKKGRKRAKSTKSASSDESDQVE